MTKPLVIFGSGDIAQLAHYYFTRDSEYEVVAFTVDRDYASVSEFCGLPLVAFDEVAQRFPPESHAMFVALAYAKLNGVRKEKYLAAKALGYELASYVSSHATVLNDGRIGENVFLLEDNTIQPFVSIGNNVTLWSGNHIGHHSTIHDHCFLASHIVVSGGVVRRGTKSYCRHTPLSLPPTPSCCAVVCQSLSIFGPTRSTLMKLAS